VTITRGTAHVFFISLRKKRLFDEDLVQVPFVSGPGLSAAQRACVPLPELGAPAAHRLIGDGAPRSNMSSSTSRNDSGKRKYSHTQWEMTSTGYR
jgi:hypothetical protein